MMYYTHIAGGVVCGTLAYTVMPTGGPISFIGGAIIGSLVPDLDHPGAILNRRSGTPSILTGFGHRTFTHSFLFAFIMLSIVMLGGLNISFNLGLFVGMLSHLLLDALNPSGVPLFWPYKHRYNIARLRTGQGGDFVVLFVCAALMYLYFKI